MSRDYYDQLIDQLLRETLGGDRPRDMTARVVALAKAHDRTRRGWWIGTGAAIAAGIAVALTLWLVWPQKGPDTVGAPDYVASNVYMFGDQVGPGVPLATASDSAGTLKIAGRDGSVDMDVAPSSSFMLGSGPRGQQRVFLESGHIDFSTKKKGAFQVLVGTAVVQASNTRFDVDVNDSFDEMDQKFLKRLVVKVLEGSAEVSGVDTPITLRAGDSQTFTISEQVQPRLIEPSEHPAKSPDAAPVLPNRAGRGGGLRRVAPSGGQPGTAQLQIIIGPGPYALDGILRHYGAYLFLQTNHGNFMLGTLENFDDRPPAPGSQSYVHVVFGKGRVTRIENIKSLPQPAQLPASPMPTVSTQVRL